MRHISSSKRKQQKAPKKQQVIQENLQQFMFPVSHMGGSSPTGNWTNQVPLKVIESSK